MHGVTGAEIADVSEVAAGMEETAEESTAAIKTRHNTGSSGYCNNKELIYTLE